MTHTFEIWTDGACLGNPGPGGWGAVICQGAHEREISGGEADTTNNRMEMTAAIAALSDLPAGVSVVVYTDSTYVRDGLTKWLPSWKARNWKTAAGKPLKNLDLWRTLEATTQRVSVRWVWVKAHAGNTNNERADILARDAAYRVSGRPVKPAGVDSRRGQGEACLGPTRTKG